MSAETEFKPFEKSKKQGGGHPNKKLNTPHPITGRYSKHRRNQ